MSAWGSRIGTDEMRLRILTLAIGCLAAAPLWASTGLTSAGVDPNRQNNAQDEPTLAQVAPVQGSNASATASTSGSAAANGAANPNIAGSQGNAAAGNAAGKPAVPAIVVPPPPPDPATLPVSVIRPVNKPAADSTSTIRTASTPDSATSATSVRDTRREAAAASPRGPATTPASTSPSPSPLSRTNAAAAARSDAASRPAPEAQQEETADGSSSGVIFYSGIGIAGAILLLSIGAFMRGRTDESPRS